MPTGKKQRIAENKKTTDQQMDATELLKMTF